MGNAESFSTAPSRTVKTFNFVGLWMEGWWRIRRDDIRLDPISSYQEWFVNMTVDDLNALPPTEFLALHAPARQSHSISFVSKVP